jgi:hypothetical protein
MFQRAYEDSPILRRQHDMNGKRAICTAGVGYRAPLALSPISFDIRFGVLAKAVVVAQALHVVRASVDSEDSERMILGRRGNP